MGLNTNYWQILALYNPLFYFEQVFLHYPDRPRSYLFASAWVVVLVCRHTQSGSAQQIRELFVGSEKIEKS